MSRARIPAAAWYALALLTLVNMFGYMDRLALSILLEAIKRDLHLTDTQLGLLSGLAFAVFYCTLGIPLARLADRTSRVRLLSACLALWSAMTALGGMARSFPQLFLARVGVGVGEAGCTPPAHSLIGDLFPRDRRTFALSIFQAGSAAGVSAGLIVVGLLGERLGWRAALQAIGLAGVPLALLMVTTVREPPRVFDAASRPLSLASALRTLLARPALVHLLLAIGIGGMTAGAFTQWVPTFLIRSFGMSMASVGASLGTVTAVTGVIGMVAGGAAVTWLGGRDPRWELWLPGFATAIAAPLFIAAMLSPTAWLVLALKVPFGLAQSVVSGVAFAAVHAFSGSRERALAISLAMFVSTGLGMGLGPFLIGWTSDALAPRLGAESLRWALVLYGATLPWAALHFFLAARRSAVDRIN